MKNIHRYEFCSLILLCALGAKMVAASVADAAAGSADAAARRPRYSPIRSNHNHEYDWLSIENIHIQIIDESDEILSDDDSTILDADTSAIAVDLFNFSGKKSVGLNYAQQAQEMIFSELKTWSQRFHEQNSLLQSMELIRYQAFFNEHEKHVNVSLTAHVRCVDQFGVQFIETYRCKPVVVLT